MAQGPGFNNDVELLKDINKLLDNVKCYLYSDDECDYYNVHADLLDVQKRLAKEIKNRTGKIDLSSEENE